LGRIVEYGDTEKIFRNPCHPYTRALLSAVLEIDNADREPVLLKGEVVSPINVPEGCRFAGRCGFCAPECTAKGFGLNEIEPDHFTACSAGTENFIGENI
jgi:oligopeptide/dipeptide ABC transporter ATP-binding protein